ncbi:MAG TPA: Ig-like domain-containing protein, partial [Spirochaetota bacterium]|nr:Ig-like domain-containing protein [Spirochaetota bacterium]
MKTMFNFYCFIFFLCALFTAGCDDGGNSDIAASGAVSVSGVSLDEETMSVKVDETFTLSATVEPANATNQNVTWSSSDEDVASVTGGLVTGLADGTADITVTTADGGKTDLCTVTVTKRDVYVAGRLATADESEVDAGYWKNGEWNNYGTALSYVSGIAVDSGTVYLCGSQYDDGLFLPVYATGTSPTILTRIQDTGQGSVDKILVRDGAVYCCGAT